MIELAATQHFAGPPEWTWFILFYFFLAGLAGGAYFLGTLLRYWGTPADEPVARLAFYVPLPAVVIGALLLTLDLKQPLRFWHMLVNTTPGAFGLNFNTTTPMSVGVWALVVASVFAVVAFVDSLARDGRLRLRLARRLSAGLDGAVGRVWNIAGTIVFLFVGGYTGVLLSVSNQPVWSDSWALGGLFLASGLSGSAALLLLLARRRAAPESIGMLDVSERLFTVLELLLVAVVVLTLIDDGTLGKAFDFPWILLWLVAFAGMLPGLRDLVADGLRGRVRTSALVPLLVLAGVLALRAAVIFSAQS